MQLIDRKDMSLTIALTALARHPFLVGHAAVVASKTNKARCSVKYPIAIRPDYRHPLLQEKWYCNIQNIGHKSDHIRAIRYNLFQCPFLPRGTRREVSEKDQRKWFLRKTRAFIGGQSCCSLLMRAYWITFKPNYHATERLWPIGPRVHLEATMIKSDHGRLDVIMVSSTTSGQTARQTDSRPALF